MGSVENETPQSATDGESQTGARKSRDLYREMKLLENPDFSHIPRETLESEIESCVAQNIAPQGDDGEEENYDCETQNSGTLDELFIGMSRGSVYLWESGSVINWIARFDGYPTRKQAIQAALAVYRAAAQWNEVLDGRVRFQYVTRFDDACFQVCYGGDRGGVLASAFFPTKWENSLNLLRVYKTQFVERHMPFIVNTMLHELGHILGLRHEHSHSGVPGWLPPEDKVNGPESVIWGARNSKSVMAYYQGQEIQESDKKAICEAYDTLDNGKKISGVGKFGAVSKTIIRVKPNN